MQQNRATINYKNDGCFKKDSKITVDPSTNITEKSLQKSLKIIK